MSLLHGSFSQYVQSGLRARAEVQAQSRGSFDQDLIDRIVFGRWVVPATYHFAIGAVVLVFTFRHWTGRIWWGSSARPNGRMEWRSRRDSAQSDRSPLLESLEPKSARRRHGKLFTLRLKLRATLTYQPPPIPYVNKVLPSNGTTLLILLLLTLNLLYLNYGTSTTLAVWTACIMDRSALLFVCNLPWLYLLAAKNQPLRLLTGHSYEGLNILHRRLGEWMCVCAVLHVFGFFSFWWFYARPVEEDPLGTLLGWLKQGYVVVGIVALTCYEVLWATSLASVRQWWYEGFLASHVVLQAGGLGFLYFHHERTKGNAFAALVVFVVDRVVYRAAIKSRTMKASVEILEDGETMLVSAGWSLPQQESRWRKLFGRDIRLGWKPLEHVFITVPALGRSHALQAHPFTIASSAPEGTQQHAWLSLIIRAREGFTKDLLRHAQALSTVDVRFDGPYGSQDAVEMLRSSDIAVLVAGGSGIAVAYPVIWSLLHAANANATAHKSRCRRVCLIWIVRDPSHISWIGTERLDELRELGLHLVLPKPTTQAGRPDVQRLLREAIEDVGSGAGGERVGVVVSAPDAMNREVNNGCAGLAWEGRDVRVAVEKFGW